KFGSAFDMKKARELADKAPAAAPAAPAPAAPAALSDEQIIEQAFRRLPEVFVPERAKGWNAAIVFDIQGAKPWSVIVKDGVCRTEPGKQADPTCTVTVDKATYS